MDSVNQQVEEIKTLAQQKLEASVKNFEQVFKRFEEFQENIPLSQQKVFELEQRSSELATKLQESERTGKLDVDLTIKQYGKSAVDSYLKEQGRVAIDSTDMAVLKSKVTEADKNMAEAVSAAIVLESSKMENALITKDLQHKAAEAENIAQIKSLNNTINSLREEVDSLRATISAERGARIEEAKARGSAAVTINNPGK